MPSKPFYYSRTLWANIVAVLIVLLIQLQAVPTIPQSWVPYLAVGIAVGNMILRLITTQPLALTAGPSAPLVYRPGVDTAAPPPAGVSFDTAPAAQPPDAAALPTLPGKEGPHDGQ